MTTVRNQYRTRTNTNQNEWVSMSTKPSLSLIVAKSTNNVIGVNNTLPWRLSADLVHFKKVTMGKAVIMGRKTYESIGRPLPGRTNIVVTRQSTWQAGGVTVVHSLEDAVAAAGACQEKEAVLIGGAELYAQGLQLCSTVYLTEVKAHIEGDAFFADLDSTEWTLISTDSHAKDEKNDHDFDMLVFKRV